MSENLQLKPKKVLSPKLDVIFQAIFGEVGSERITKRFLQSILKEKIDTIDLSKSQVLRREYENDKLGILDIIAKINEKEICNIEMQIANKEDIIERILYYWGRIYTRQIKEGEEYKRLEKTIIILITDFKIKSLEKSEYHTKWKIIEEKERKIILTDKLELHIISLAKMRETEERQIQDELLDWLYFLENPKSERVKEKMEENEELKEAVEKVETMSDDEYMQRIADLREKAIRDEKSSYCTGLHEGEVIGEKKGEKIGAKKAKLETAKKMLEEKIPLEVIIRITGLTKEEIMN